MTTTTKAAAAAALMCAVAISIAARNTPPDHEPSSGPPAKIYGDTRPAGAAPVDDMTEQRRLARRWALAWTTASSCGDASSVRRVIALSTGELRRALSTAPPRPAAGVPCERSPKVVSIVLTPRASGGARAIVERPGESGGDSHLELEITQTSAGLRAAALTY